MMSTKPSVSFDVDIPCRNDHLEQELQHRSRRRVKLCMSEQYQHQVSLVLWSLPLQYPDKARRNQGVLQSVRKNPPPVNNICPTVEVLELLGHVWIWVDLLKCVVGL